MTPWWLLAARLADAPGDTFLRAPSGMAHSVTEEALSGLAYVMLATGGASPCPPDLGDTVPEPGRRIPKEMLRKTENAFRGPSACTQTPSPGSPCEGAAHLPTGSVYRVRVTRPYAGPSPSCKTAPTSGPRDVLGDVTQRAPRDRCGFLTLRWGQQRCRGRPWGTLGEAPGHGCKQLPSSS